MNDLFDNAIEEFGKAIDLLDGTKSEAQLHIARGLAELTEAIKAESKRTRRSLRDMASDIKSIR